MIINMEELVSDITKYEAGEMSEDDTLSFFQELVNTGLIWELQGHYGRTAIYLIENGLITVPDVGEE